MASQLHQIRQVAHLHGGCTPYLDGCQPRQAASSESLLTAMPALGASVETARDGPDALRTYRRELWWRFCEPVLVAWDGVPPSVELQLPLDVHDKTEVACQLTLETWEARWWTTQFIHCPVVREADIEGVLPWCYHQVRFETGGQS